MFSKLKNNDKGFTIIEVLIVLAIGGLIMVIVFLAVPALQRQQRNTGRKSDIGQLGGAVTEWVSNNNGAVLTAGPANANLTAIISSAGKLSQYSLVAAGAVGANSFTLATGTQAALPPGASNVNGGSVQVVVGATCGANGATTANTSKRRMVLQYFIENASTIVPLCQEV